MSNVFTRQNVAGLFAALAISGLYRWYSGNNLGK